MTRYLSAIGHPNDHDPSGALHNHSSGAFL
jgi:hypothetical protein